MKFLSFFGLLFCAAYVTAATDKIICYYGSWAYYRSGNAKFDMETIDSTLCTHLIYAFAGLTEDGQISVMDNWLDISLNGYQRFNNLKIRNPKLKTLIAIGGWNAGTAVFQKVFNDDKLRGNFVNSVMAFLDKYKFDGLDIDWEYPSANDKVGYVKGLSELRTRFNSRGYLLSAAVAALSGAGYNATEMNKYLDFLNVMSYDLNGPWDTYTGINSALYAGNTGPSWTRSYNFDSIRRTWISLGMSPGKIIMGVALYGHTYTLESISNNAVGSPASGAGTAGPYTRQAGVLSYLEICEIFKTTNYNINWKTPEQVPYAFYGNQWISYDDIQSVELKAKYSIEQNLGGIMVWAIDFDDAKNSCGKEGFALMRTINKVMNGGPIITTTTTVPSVTTTVKPSTIRTTTTIVPSTTKTTTTVRTTPSSTTTTQKTTTMKTTTKAPETLPICPSSGFLTDPTDCQYYYQCIAGIPIYLSWRHKCQDGLLFNRYTNRCDYAFNVDC